MINSILGRYKIKRLIGEGGMASVYEAEHEMLGTKVAIKVLSPILSSNFQIIERFRNEAKLMASLDHPNITKVIDFDEKQGHLFIIMEYLHGEDLSNLVKRTGPLSEKELMGIFEQILSACQYAHENGIVHRDIKPSNIFVLHDGSIKILDFGIAKLFGQGNEMTQTGTQMGSPIYMSPEQVKADKSIDHRSDIYSLGVTMFFAMNGKPPYNSDTESQFDIFSKIVNLPLPELSNKSHIGDCIKKATEKHRDLRFQTCDEFLSSLKKLSEANYKAKEKNNLNTKESLHNPGVAHGTEELRPNEARGSIAISLLKYVLAFEILSLITTVFQFDSFKTGRTFEIISIIYVILLAASAVTFIQWFRRAYFNLHLRVNNLSYPEGWAAAGWFVPFFNLYVPYQIMKELFKETKKRLFNKGVSSNANDLTSSIELWWLFYILATVVAMLTIFSSLDMDTLFLFSSVVNIPYVLITLNVIRGYSKLEKIMD